MRVQEVMVWIVVALAGSNAALLHHLPILQARQAATNSSFPLLSGSSPTVLSSSTTASLSDSTTYSPISTTTASLSTSTSLSQNSGVVIRASQISTSIASTTTHQVSPTASPQSAAELPIQPHITPALSLGGVFLILTGVAYCLIGVKNQWLQVFLSAGYLASLSVAVLIDYIITPPVSNAVQGAYFVGILMTGLVLGAGALVFKDITEGLGCLLGGYSLSMWLLTLKSGGVVTGSVGKGIFIGVFCALVWALSFHRTTRLPGLIGSTSFTGATMVVLGIDCFSRAGYKEFWIYIWGINNNLFPLSTNTYPITRGMRVEIIAIILGCIIGVVSQIKLWKIIRDRQKNKEEARLEDERRRDVVEEALGRQLEQKNDRDRLQWEKQYGNRLLSKRQSMLWSQANPNKRYTNVKIREIGSDHPSNSTSSESLEMKHMDVPRTRAQAMSRSSRQSVLSIRPIPEGDEEKLSRIEMQREIACHTLEGTIDEREAKTSPNIGHFPKSEVRQSLDGQPMRRVDSAHGGSDSEDVNSRQKHEPDRNSRLETTLDVEDADSDTGKRRSIQSLLSVLPRSDRKRKSKSHERLISHSPARSRASSVAATLDEENEAMELPSLEDDTYADGDTARLPAPLGSLSVAGQFSGHIKDWTPSPPAIAENFDPEELARTPDASPGNQEEPLLSVKEYFAKATTVVANEATSDSPILTMNALESLPRQSSSKILSFRTDEWAKHIVPGDEPLYTEPESFEEDGEEPADPRERLGLPKEHPVNVNTQSTRARAMTPEGLVIAVTAPSPRRAPTKNAYGQSNPQRPLNVRPLSMSRASSSSSSERSSRRSEKAPARHSLRGTVIDENVVTTFQPQLRSASGPLPSVTRQHPIPYTSQTGIVPFANTIPLHGVAPRSIPRQSTTVLPPRHSVTQIRSASDPPKLTETRMSKTFDSHQPHPRAIMTQSEKRQVSYEGWRATQLRSTSQDSLSLDPMDARRAQMLAEKQQKRLMEQQQGAFMERRQHMVDQVMRRSGMHDLHQEALRKMQASAYKHI